MDKNLSAQEWDRYQRHLALPGISAAHQLHLKQARLLMIGAGGLGAAALPYLAGAGIGHITIIDHDTVDCSNLHRQTIFKTAEAGQSKAALAAAYIRSLNPGCAASAIQERLTAKNAAQFCRGFTLILDGSDNFETKTLLNDISLETRTSLISASVNQMQGQIGIFAGYSAEHPCYHCLFPELPHYARNCNEAGVLGTAAGLTGLYQAHLALALLLGLDGTAPGTLIHCDYASLRMQHLRVNKDPQCAHCSHLKQPWVSPGPGFQHIELLHPSDLKNYDHLIVDVRTDEEVNAAPIPGAIHIALHDLPLRFRELPQDRLLAFACAANIRSRQAAEYMQHKGYSKICVMDRLA